MTSRGRYPLANDYRLTWNGPEARTGSGARAGPGARPRDYEILGSTSFLRSDIDPCHAS